MSTAVAFAAALIGCVALAAMASAASNPVAAGSTTAITLNKGFNNKLKKSGVKVLKVSPATIKGTVVTMPVGEGSLDPTNGQGTLTNEGGIKFKAGSKSAVVKALVLDTTSSSLTGNVAGKKMKFASVSGISSVRNGFGANVTIKSLKLTGGAATQLNKKLGFTGKPKKKKNKRAQVSKKKSSAQPFKGGAVLGSSVATTQPSKVSLLPGGSATLATNPSTLGKLAEAEVSIVPTGGTTETSKDPSPVYTFPISGGNISPSLTSGVVETSGGVKLTQKLQTGATTYLETEITLEKIDVDLAAKTLTAEVIAKSNASKALDLGNLGRASIADVNVTGAAITVDPLARTISVQNAAATLQPVSAEVLNGFVQVYAAYYAQAAQGPPLFKTEEEAKKEAAEFAAANAITTGAPLGIVSFSTTTQ